MSPLIKRGTDDKNSFNEAVLLIFYDYLLITSCKFWESFKYFRPETTSLRLSLASYWIA